jgi:hypothetical protein
MWEHFNQALSQSIERIIAGIADLLPGILAFLVVMIIALPLAWVAGRLLRRSLNGVRFDDRMRQWGFSNLTEWSPWQSPTMMLDRIVFWTILLVGLLTGLTALNVELTWRLAVRVLEYVPNLFIAVLILFVGNLAARFLSRGALIGAVNMQLKSARLISLGVKWLILVCAAAMALEHLSVGGVITRMAFAILFGGIVLTFALAIGLGWKDLAARSRDACDEKAQDERSEPFQHL